MLRTLQAGRGVAAIAVLLYHLNLELVARFGGASVSGLEVGWAGVDFFFVLSGFIIWHVHAGDIGQDGRLGRYLWNRFTRLYPVYWAVLAVALALRAIP
jgi:peptidoglycan/LPS O-acetylase OafA/YrhL